MNRMIVAGGMLVSSSLLAYFAKSPFILVLGLFAILYFLMFSSQIYTEPPFKLSGDDYKQVGWLGVLSGGTGIYSFQVNKAQGLCVWLSNSVDTSKPAYVLFIDDLQYGTSLYSYDGQNLSSAPVAPPGSFKLSYVQNITRATPAPLLNLMVFPTGIYLYGADASDMAADSAPDPTVPLYQAVPSTRYLILQYVWTDATTPTCLSNIGFASSTDTDNEGGGSIINKQVLTPPGGLLTAVTIRSHSKGMSNQPDPSDNQIVFDPSWVMTTPGTGIFSFRLNFVNTDDYQSGLVVIASPWPGYQDSMVSHPDGTQYYFFFNKESHDQGQITPLNYCVTNQYCWEGISMRQWSSDDDGSEGINLCEAWGPVDSEANSSLYQGWADSRVCSNIMQCSNVCRTQAGKNCRLLDQTSSFSGSQGCCNKASTAAYKTWRELLWEQECGTCVQCFVQFSQDSMQMGFIDSQGNAQNLLQQSYTPDPDNPIKYWGVAVTGVGKNNSSNICHDLRSYHDTYARLTLSNISLSMPGVIACSPCS